MFSDLLNKTKGFKYQITVKVLLKKYKIDEEIEFRPVYFNSVTKTVTNHRFQLESSFQETLYMIDNWINEGSGSIIEFIESQYINISNYRPLSGSSYMNLKKFMLNILILQKNIQKELKKLTKKLLKNWLWWNWVSCTRKRF